MYIEDEIAALKKEKEAIILAHYYVPDEVQAYADYVGDSFGLAKKAVETDAKIIVFAGVDLWVRAQDAQSPKESPHARCDGDLSHGPYADTATIEKPAPNMTTWPSSVTSIRRQP